MPVEILEIVVRANVQEADTNVAAVNTVSNAATNNGNAKEKIIQECVEQVLAILQHNKER
jgi:Holliday junction resolvasome RuvABC endonuclease subunit